MTNNTTYAWFLSPWVVAAVIGLAAIVLGWSYLRPARTGAGKRVALMAPRLMLLGLAFVLAMRPVRQSQQTMTERGQAVIAIDVSASMNTSDGGATSRMDRVKAFLQAEADQLEQLDLTLDLQRWAFADETMPAPKLPATGSGPTDLALLLDTIRRDHAFKNAGVVLVTDGRATVGEDPLSAVERLAETRVPVHVLQVGDAQAPRETCDLDLQALQAPEEVQIGDPVMVRGTLRSRLAEPATATLRLSLNDDEVERTERTLAAGDDTAALRFRVTPETVGMHRITLEADTLPDETQDANNRRSVYVRVVDSRRGVWWLEGDARWEWRFARRALQTRPRLQLENVLAPGPGPAGAGLPRDLQSRETLGVLVLGNVAAGRLNEQDYVAIRAFVEHGGGLLVVAGPDVVNEGSYRHTPLARLMPVQLNPSDRWVDAPAQARSSDAALSHPAAAEWADPNPEFWRRLRPLRGRLQVRGPRATATVVLQDSEGTPLLVTMPHRRGRVALLLTDQTWRWTMAPSKRRRPRLHQRFWTGLIDWLSQGRHDDQEQVIWAETDSREYAPGSPVTLRVRVAPREDQKDWQQTTVLLRLIKPSGDAAPVDIGRGPGEHVHRFAAGAAGAYTARVELITTRGEVAGEASCGFTVSAPDAELVNVAADAALLRAVAERTGGLYLKIEDGGEALDAIAERDVATQRELSRRQELWNHPLALLAVLALLSGEWLLRRLLGLK